MADFPFDGGWRRGAFPKNEKCLDTTRISQSTFHYVQLLVMLHFLLKKTTMCAPNINLYFLKPICGPASGFGIRVHLNQRLVIAIYTSTGSATVNPLSAPSPVLILFYLSCLPCSQMICCIGLVCLNRAITRCSRRASSDGFLHWM